MHTSAYCIFAQNAEEFEKGISASQYQKLTSTSKATATRHLGDLLAKECVEKLGGGGRSTRYKLVVS